MVNVLHNVAEDKKFWISDGRQVSSLKELHNTLEHMNGDTFNYHVNESKNDFYNWVKDVYGDKKLADDLIDCNTKDAVLFCVKSRLEQEEALSLINELPKENTMDNVSETLQILNELPKKNVLERVQPKAKKRLVTLLDPSLLMPRKEKMALESLIGVNVLAEKLPKKPSVTIPIPSLSKNKAVKKQIQPKKVKNTAEIKPQMQNEKFNKSQIKKIKQESAEEMIKKLKEVYDLG